MNTFRFAEIGWGQSLWIVAAVCAILLVLELRRRSALDRLLSVRMQSRLVHQLSRSRRVIAITCFGLTCACVVLALMRPQWVQIQQRMQSIDSQLMICLDVSKSMLAEDVVPNRLERAKAEIDSLLGILGDGQQVGLIAFAGKATVMCPLTTDFSFLRLIMAEADPDSVGLGGTRIGEAIDVAVKGFRESGDINRLILLITDGEDHDSFPLDAAERAKEHGVRIVSVGFGDEAGSKIAVTDPATGAQGFLKDAAGEDVVTRLDGETLRDIALETEGAYIPAGTGALDLQSIYDQHVQSLLEGTASEQTTVVRNEGYQWFALAALVFGCLYILARRSWTRTTIALQGHHKATAALVILLALMPGSRISAQGAAGPPADAPIAPPSPGVPADAAENSNTDAAGPTALASAESNDSGGDIVEKDEPARTIYNRAIRVLQSSPDRAQELLLRAKAKAGVDGELRFRALYNLGWVEVIRADQQLESDPAAALERLEQAAARFQESIQIRPENDQARQNLEIIMLRILALRDSLNRTDATDLKKRLDELILRETQHLSELRNLSEMLPPDQFVGSDSRPLLRQVGVTQRQIIGDLEILAREAQEQLDALANAQAAPGQDQASEDQLEAVQIQAMLGHLNRGIQRLHRARSLTRRSQPSDAFNRWSSGLSDLKRARDQLRNPIETLGILIADVRQQQGLTSNLLSILDGPTADASSDPTDLPNTETSSTTVDAPVAESTQRPSWLSDEYLTTACELLNERTSELGQLLQLIGQADSNQGNQIASDADEANAEQRRAQLQQEAIAAAAPLVIEAAAHLRNAATLIEGSEFSASYDEQSSALSKLESAAELFLDIRRLIELVYQDQLGVQQQLDGVVQSLETPTPDSAEIDAILEIARSLQSINSDRMERLEALLRQEKEELAQAPANEDSAESSASETERIDLAIQIRDQIEQNMQSISSTLSTVAADDLIGGRREQQSDADDEASPPPDQMPESEQDVTTPEDSPEEEDAQPTAAADVLPQSTVTRTIEQIEELRRLYFTLLEHLKETAARQNMLNEDTLQSLAGTPDAASAETLNALGARQGDIQEIGQQIGSALESQAEQAAQAGTPDGAAGELDGQAFTDAAALVASATEAMEIAKTSLANDSGANLNQVAVQQSVSDSQRSALEDLVEAIRILDDRQQENSDQSESGSDDDSQEGQQDQQQNSQSQTEQNQSQDTQSQDRQEQSGRNSAELLQAIRDREAERRNARRGKAVPVAGGGVDKDW